LPAEHGARTRCEPDPVAPGGAGAPLAADGATEREATLDAGWMAVGDEPPHAPMATTNATALIAPNHREGRRGRH